MKWRNITAKKLQKIISKLSLEKASGKRRSPHKRYWYWVDGKRQFGVTFPNVHGGGGSVSTGFLKQVQNQLKIEQYQFEDLVECPLSAGEYEKIIRQKLDLT